MPWVVKKIAQEIKAKGDLADTQYGFWEKRSTVDAARRVLEIAEGETKKTRKTRKLCALVTTDVKHAFNTLPWTAILDALERGRVTPSLIRLYKANSRTGVSKETLGSQLR